jgi:hypothetical protein
MKDKSNSEEIMSKNEELKGIRLLRGKLAVKNGLLETPKITEYSEYELTEEDMISIEKMYYLKESKKLLEENFNEKLSEIIKKYKEHVFGKMIEDTDSNEFSKTISSMDEKSGLLTEDKIVEVEEIPKPRRRLSLFTKMQPTKVDESILIEEEKEQNTYSSFLKKNEQKKRKSFSQEIMTEDKKLNKRNNSDTNILEQEGKMSDFGRKMSFLKMKTSSLINLKETKSTEDSKIFGVSIDKVMSRKNEKGEIPEGLEYLIDQITEDYSNTELLFYYDGYFSNKEIINKTMRLIDGKKFKMIVFTEPHQVSEILKRYLFQLPESILELNEFHLYEKIFEFETISEIKIKMLKNLIDNR